MLEHTLCITLAVLLLLGFTVLHIHLRRKREKEAQWNQNEPEFASEPDGDAEPLITEEARRLLFERFREWGRPGMDMALLSDAAPVAVGGTKIGGCPDLAPGFEWPCYREPETGQLHYLSFMAQVNLSEMAAGDPQGELPSSGMLYFFYDMQSERWGLGSQDEGCSRVIYVEDTSALARGSFPDALPQEHRYAEWAVSLAPVIIPPCWDELNEAQMEEVARIYEETTPEERHQGSDRLFMALGGFYITLRAEWRGYEDAYCESRSLLLGNPDNIQNEMRTECEEIARKRELGLPSAHEFSEQEEEEIEAASKDWVLLFQLASIIDEEKGDLMFGDVGNLYFWMRRQDLEARDFHKAWLLLQCY